MDRLVCHPISIPPVSRPEAYRHLSPTSLRPERWAAERLDRAQCTRGRNGAALRTGFAIIKMDAVLAVQKREQEHTAPAMRRLLPARW
eukprot:SAG31_NODE_953_length_10799_cov_4.245657_11_plen_88_part_00